MKALYPTSFADLNAWADEHRIALTEARARFAQACVLQAVADSRRLSQVLVFKGGNALDFVWQPNRSTKDLDFSATEPSLEESDFRSLLGATLEQIARRTGARFRVQSIKRKPPGPDKTRATWAITVGYALPDEPALIARMDQSVPSPVTIPMEVSINEEVCADAPIDVGGQQRLRVSTLEDIVAEKLRSLLQQVLRKRDRRQDLLDIAVLLRLQPRLNISRVSEYLLRKAQVRDVPVSKAAFRAAEVRERAKVDYDQLKSTTRQVFVPFEEALQALYGLVDQLEIPEA